MPRVKGGYVTRRRRNKVLKLAKGYFGSKHTLYKTANEQVMRSLRYQYRDRRNNKRNFRKLWISRINAACKMNDMKYSKFINGLKIANITINRKMLADLAVNDMEAFKKYVEIAKNPEVKVEVKKAAKTVKTEETKVVKPAKVEEAKVVEPVKVTEEVTKAESVKLEDLKVTELKELAKSKGITGYTTMKKSELIEALK